MLWEHKPQASVSKAFSSSPKLSLEVLRTITPEKHGEQTGFFYRSHSTGHSHRSLELCTQTKYVFTEDIH